MKTKNIRMKINPFESIIIQTKHKMGKVKWLKGEIKLKRENREKELKNIHQL